MKIPENAKRVFKGVIFSVYQWDQERFDGSTGTYEMIKRLDSAMVIPTMGDKILICKQEQPRTGVYYSLFGGQMGENEEPLPAAKRELKEESGLTSENWELYKTYEPSNKFAWNMYLFIAHDCQKVAEQHLDPGEKIEIMEVTFEQFVEIVESDDFWGKELTLDLFRRQKAGTLGEFKQKLFPQHS